MRWVMFESEAKTVVVVDDFDVSFNSPYFPTEEQSYENYGKMMVTNKKVKK